MPLNLHALLLASLLVLSGPLAIAQEAKAPAPSSPLNHFHSDTLHFSFDIPDDVIVHPELSDKVNDGLKNGRKTPTGQPCITVPLIAFNPTLLRRIYFYQSDITCFPDGLSQERLRTAASAMLTSILKSMGSPSVASPIDYDLAKKPAVVVSGSVFSPANHGIVFGEAGCVLLDGYSACWVFISSSAAKVARLAEMPLRFDDLPPVPVIPPDASGLAVPSTGTYHDDARHFTFTYPGSFVDAQQRTKDLIAKKIDDSHGKEKTALGCMGTPFSSDERTDNAHSSILIFNFNMECQKLKVSNSVLRDIATGMTKGISTTAKKSKSEKPVMYSLAGQDAVLIELKITSETEVDAFLAEACTIVSGDILCWQFYSTSHERLAQIAASQVSFNGALPTPVVPPELLKAY